MATRLQNQAWAKGHPGWKAKTQARFAKNHPPPLFPSADVTPKETTGLMSSARQQVAKTYASQPMPALQTYLQPFADAHARNAAAGENYVNYLRSATGTAQNLTGAFGAALTGGMGAGQESVQAQGGSAPANSGIPTAAASLIPAASVGSSFANYLNAQQPYVGAAVNETGRLLDAQQGKALADYRTAEAARRADVLDATQKIYNANLQTLQDQKNAGVKNAVTEYLALGKTAYQKSQLAQRGKQFDVTTGLKRDKLALDAASLAERAGYHQKSLDAKRTSAASKGIDLSPAYKLLLVTSPGGAGGSKTGPVGQRGRWYTVTPTTYTASGTALAGKAVKQFVPYGDPVPTAKKGPNGPTLTVVPGDYAYPPKTSSTRRATPASWDRAVSLLRNKYPGRITASWLKTNFPPRPAGT